MKKNRIILRMATKAANVLKGDEYRMLRRCLNAALYGGENGAIGSE